MGASMARIFAREGAKVAVADMLDDEGKQVAADIVQANGAAIFRQLDVTSEAEWKAAVDATIAEFGRLDILVNDAGLSGSAVEDLFDTAAWDRLMAVNARGVFLGMKFAIPIMKAAGGGSIVNISSISGITGQHGLHVGYNASKGAVRTLTKAAAVQHGRDNIRVNSVHPGLMPPMRSSGRTADPEARARMLQHVPMGRAGGSRRSPMPCCFSPRTKPPTSPALSSMSTAAPSRRDPHPPSPAGWAPPSPAVREASGRPRPVIRAIWASSSVICPTCRPSCAPSLVPRTRSRLAAAA